LRVTAHSLIQFQQLSGGLRRWATTPLETFNDALKAYKIAVEYLVVPMDFSISGGFRRS
jgi:hypothetical protein